MNREFWQRRWQQNEIAFHQAGEHALLRKHWPTLNLTASSRILVPLCGKSVDMRWLADQGHEVIGIEFSTIAARDFFNESGLSYTRRTRGAFDCFIGDRIEIRVGDFFDLPRQTLAEFDGFYDRAGLVALPPDMRGAYVNHLMGGQRRGTTGLLITIGYDPSLMDGPPFNVDDEEVGKLYGRYAHVDLMAERRGLAEDDPLRKRGLTTARDGVYRIVRR